jgi:hypothetical protein
MVYGLGDMGIAAFAFLVTACFLEVFLMIRHKKLGEYTFKLHHYGSVVPGIGIHTGHS